MSGKCRRSGKRRMRSEQWERILPAAHWFACELWETRRRGQEGRCKYQEERLAGSCINTSGNERRGELGGAKKKELLR